MLAPRAAVDADDNRTYSVHTDRKEADHENTAVQSAHAICQGVWPGPGSGTAGLAGHRRGGKRCALLRLWLYDARWKVHFEQWRARKFLVCRYDCVLPYRRHGRFSETQHQNPECPWL